MWREFSFIPYVARVPFSFILLKLMRFPVKGTGFPPRTKRSKIKQKTNFARMKPTSGCLPARSGHHPSPHNEQPGAKALATTITNTPPPPPLCLTSSALGPTATGYKSVGFPMVGAVSNAEITQ